METVFGELKDALAGIKRCYVGDMVIEMPCPNCKNIIMNDFEEQYLSYPVVGRKDYIYFYCENCSSEFELPIKIKSAKMVVEYDPSKIK